MKQGCGTIMKKIIDFLIGILLAIVYPNRILNLFRVRNLDQNSNRILGNDNVVKVLAFIAALIFVIAVRYIPATTNTHQQTVPGIPLEPYIGEGYTYWGSMIPTEVVVALAGDSTDIELMAFGNIRAYIDLSGFGTGIQNNVVVNIVGVPDHITWTASPSMLDGIEIDSIESAEFRVTPLPLLPTLPDSRYKFSEISVNPEYVIATGPSRIISEIDSVMSSFDITTMSLEPRSITREGVLLALSNDAQMEGIEFNPTSVDIEIEIYEDLRPINIEVNENLLNVPQDQIRIIEVIPDYDEIQVWGDFDDMEDTLELLPFNFANLDSEGQIIIPLEPQLPIGVSSEPDQIVVTVIYEEIPPEPVDDDDDDDEDD